MKKVIKVDDREIGFKATALTLRLYRHFFGRDMISDMVKLKKAYRKAAELPEDAAEEERQEAQLSALDLEIFENAAWVMAWQYDKKAAGEGPDKWLDEFKTFSIYEIFPDILALWELNQKTTAKPKKK
ncbi:hypothetical protein IMSAGC007_04681 [Lachnospiraceae bacterium]|nr:hypothetical protein IMSAGC007_04681 [Lachnospiraceae bacterium]